MIRDLIIEREPGSSFHLTTLARTLDRWGFEFGQGTRTQRYKEKDHIIVSRAHYLRRIMRNRSETKTKIHRSEVYLDESYVNKNHSNDWVWYSNDDGPWIQKPTGKGERLIIVNAITRDGWVPEAKLVFKSTKKTGDYHGQMNWDLFKRWFCEKLIPNILKNSIIIMDNAPYHNILAADSPPTPHSRKEAIINGSCEELGDDFIGDYEGKDCIKKRDGHRRLLVLVLKGLLCHLFFLCNLLSRNPL